MIAMARPFSVYKRATNLVDLIWDHTPGVKSYRVECALNFDESFYPVATVPFDGLILPGTPRDGAFVNLGSRGKVRFRFRPTDLAPNGTPLQDADTFFLRLIPIDFAGVEGTVGPMQMVVPYGTQPNRPIVLSGVIPQGASVDDSVIIHLPSQVQGANIRVSDGASLFISFEDEGDEYEVADTGPGLDNNFPSFGVIRLRGGAGTSTFSALFSLRNNGFT